MTSREKQDKKELRAHYRSIRKKIDEGRREEAALYLPIYLEAKLKQFKEVLSFFSFGSEINTIHLNQMLVKEGKLALFKMNGKEMIPYKVTNLQKETKDFGMGFLEPDPNFCAKAENFRCVIVPGIVFDSLGGRIGYGKGHYDQFMEKNPSLHYIAIGFREQLSLEPLPRDPHDRSYTELCLV